MEKNIGKIDRIIRVIVGSALIIFGSNLEQRVLSLILALFGLISIIEGFTGYCGLYNLLKINTRR